MKKARVVPSENVYRQMHDGQVQFSLALCDSRRKRSVDVCALLQNGDVAENQLFSESKHSKRIKDTYDYDEIWGLPDTIVPEKNSEIIDHLTEKRQKDHNRAVSLLQMDLSSITVSFEPLFRQIGLDFLQKMSNYNDNIEKCMHRIEDVSFLTSQSYQDMTDIWNKVCHESFLKRKCIKELDDIYAKFESERKNRISSVLRKYTTKLEKISYLIPFDVHRLMANEAMMINHALLANRHALAKLSLNWTEDILKMEVFHRMKWEDKLQFWKEMKLLKAINQFKRRIPWLWKRCLMLAEINTIGEFLNSPHIQNPVNIQEALYTLKSDQKIHHEQRIQVLEILRNMAPPRISEAFVSEWYSALSVINEKIDCIHIEKMKDLHKIFENNWQNCLAEVDIFRKEVSTYGFSTEEIQHIVNLEILPMVSQCQSQTEGCLAEMDKAFGGLARIITHESKCLFEFTCKAAQLWDVHCAGLLDREQQLQNKIHSISQIKESQLDVMLDKCRQESSKETLKSSLEKTLNHFEGIKNGYMNVYKEKLEYVEFYPFTVLQELQTYSQSVSHFFKVKEVYGQNSEEFYKLYPSLKLGESRTALKNERLRKEHSDTLKPHLVNEEILSVCLKDDQECKHQIFSKNKEIFITTKGNVYSCNGFHSNEDQQTTIVETQLVLYPKAFIVELLKSGLFDMPFKGVAVAFLNSRSRQCLHEEALDLIQDLFYRPSHEKLSIEMAEFENFVSMSMRQAFFNHLEERFHIILTNAVTTMEASKEELKTELDLYLQLHKMRTERIKMDTYNVREAELVEHQACVDQHCRDIFKVLGDWRTELKELQIQQIKLTKDFRKHIQSAEDDLSLATKSEKLTKHCSSLRMAMEKHLSIVQALQRDFRQKTELKMEGLREANAQIMIIFKLFTEGGNWTSKEIDILQSHLEKVDKVIESVEAAIIQDMEGMESKCVEEAKEILRQFESKYRFLYIDLKFIEKIEHILNNTCVLIKGEAIKSTMQKKNIDSKLSDLQEIMAEHGELCPDKNVVTEAEIINLTNCLMDELKLRFQYLECLDDASMAVPSSKAPLQGAFAAATRPRPHKQGETCSPDMESLLQPSSIGMSFLDDVAVGVIKGLLKAGKCIEEVNTNSTERQSTELTAKLEKSFDESGQRLGKSPSQSEMGNLHGKPVESINGQSVQRLSKPNPCDSRIHIYDSGSEEQKNSLSYKASITSILWRAKHFLLLVAEEFYKRNEGRAISCSQQVPETFEKCAKEINRRLNQFKNQSLDRHKSFLQEFLLQLKDIEVFISSITEKLLFKLRDQYLKDLKERLTDIQHRYRQIQQPTELKMKELCSMLKMCQSKAICERELKELVVAEEERQEQQNQAIQNVRHEVQACIHKNAQEFVAAFASFAEALLLQLDKLLTIHDVQVGDSKLKRVNINTLIRQNLAGFVPEDLVQKSSRTWPGIYYFGSNQERPFDKQRTATITTAKTTLGHLRTIEVRDALHKHYGQIVQDELRRADQEYEAQKIQMQQWHEYWQSKLNNLTDQEMYGEKC